ncbi:MAG: hypothetical protein HRF43_02170 [Phycisphaerae bacterium]|jgi:hypothetical protein
MAPVAVLPAFLGLYFFLLFGLLIGALMYRAALPAAPVPRRRLYLIGGLTGGVLWTACLAGEYRYLPEGAFNVVRSNITMVLDPPRREEVRRRVAEHVRDQINEQYPPGGIVGYARWAIGKGTLSIPRVIDQTTLTYRLPGPGWRWPVRVLLSLVLTVGAILSQFLGLAAPRPGSDRPAELDHSTA